MTLDELIIRLIRMRAMGTSGKSPVIILGTSNLPATDADEELVHRAGSFIYKSWNNNDPDNFLAVSIWGRIE